MNAVPQEIPASDPRAKTAVALLLTFAAGCVDIIGYLSLYQIFTANMTGDTVHLARNVVGRRWSDAFIAGAVVAAFLCGSVVGRTVIEVGARWRARSVASATLFLEAALIASVVPLGDGHFHHAPIVLLLAMLAAAMGLQTATLTRIGPLTVHTTFVTGMLNKLAQLLSHGAFLTYDLIRGRDASAHRRRVLRQARLIGSIWVLYLLGALAGTWLKSEWGIHALLLPAGVVLAAMIVDQWVPLAIEEEHEEPER